jgi:hypothetical protein
MLGKTFKGLTDEMLAWQTERLRSLAVADDGHVVRVRPELVVEVAFDGVQASPRYPGGWHCVRRVKGYRPDKRRRRRRHEMETLREIYRRQTVLSRRGFEASFTPASPSRQEHRAILTLEFLPPRRACSRFSSPPAPTWTCGRAGSPHRS